MLYVHERNLRILPRLVDKSQRGVDHSMPDDGVFCRGACFGLVVGEVHLFPQ